MAWQNAAGEAVGRPEDSSKARGRNLSLEGAIRLRDMIGLLLVDDLGLSKPDAAFVMGLYSVTEDHLRRRLRAIPPSVKSGFRELRREACSPGSG